MKSFHISSSNHSKLPDRFWDKVMPEPNSGCWIWMSALTGDGYGQFWCGGKRVRAHRFSYEFLIRKIPDGLCIDHLCRVRCCVNPVHLEPVTLQENIRRGEVGWKANKTHCINGHSFDEENTHYTKRGKRHCRECNKLRTRRYRNIGETQ